MLALPCRRRGGIHGARPIYAGLVKLERDLKAYFTNLMIPKQAGWWKDPLWPAGKGLQAM
jgi:hypothetical protein